MHLYDASLCLAMDCPGLLNDSSSSMQRDDASSAAVVAATTAVCVRISEPTDRRPATDLTSSEDQRGCSDNEN